MDTEPIKRTYLVLTHDGWHEFRASFAEAELEARAYALSSYQHGGNGRAYLFTVPNGAGNQPAEVEFSAARKPINLPLGVASCCRLYVADPYRGGNATGSLGLVNPDIVRHHFAEIFAPSAQYSAPAKPAAPAPALASDCARADALAKLFPAAVLEYAASLANLREAQEATPNA